MIQSMIWVGLVSTGDTGHTPAQPPEVSSTLTREKDVQSRETRKGWLGVKEYIDAL